MAAGDEGLDGEVMKIVKKKFEGCESVSLTELTQTMTEQNLHFKDDEETNDKVKNKEVQVTLGEFMNLVQSESSLEATLKKTFETFDLNHDGFVTLEEVKSVLDGSDHKISVLAMSNIISTLDNNNDGKVSYGEFIDVMMNRVTNTYIQF